MDEKYIDVSGVVLNALDTIEYATSSKEKRAIHDMKQLLQLVEKRVNGELDQTDRDLLEKNTEKWEESISVLREEILNNRIYKCKSCGQKIRVPKNKRLEVTCPKCNQEFTVDDTMGKGAESIKKKKVKKNSDSGYEEDPSRYEKNLSKVQYYDGTDITKECADKVGVNQYIELDDYVIFARKKSSDNLLSTKELIRCSKATGEELVLDLTLHPEIIQRLSRITFVMSKEVLNGCEKYLYYIYNESNICRIDVETQQSEIISFENKITKMQVSKYYIAIMYENEENKVWFYDLETKEKKVLEFEDRIDKLYLFEKKVFFFGNYDFYQWDIETEKLIMIEDAENTVDDETYVFLRSLDNVKYYRGILYYKDFIGEEVLLLDTNNPMTIQKLKICSEKAKLILGYKKIYYIRLDSSGEIGFYDIITKEKGIIKQRTNDVVRVFTEGRLIEKKSYLEPIEIQIVGKWLYYKPNDYMDQEEKCIEVVL